MKFLINKVVMILYFIFCFQVKREHYFSFEHFLINPCPIYLDCHPKGWVADLNFFQELIPGLYKQGTDPGPAKKIGWLSDDVSLLFYIFKGLDYFIFKNVK